MSSVLWHVTTSLDGFITGPQESMDWMAEAAAHEKPSAMAAELVRRTGAALVGRRFWDQPGTADDGSTGIYGGAWHGPVYVLTHQAEDRPPRPGVEYVSGDLVEVVQIAKNGAGDKDLGIFGADVARQCLAAGLIDEIVIHQVQVLLGDGVRLYSTTDGPRISLQVLQIASNETLVELRLRPTAVT